MKFNPLNRFVITITSSLLIIFIGHILFLKYKDFPPFENKIILAYLVNYAMAVGTYTFLYSFRNRFKNQLGFIFMASSFLKFILFFLFFYGTYSADNTISKLEFGAFFTPYLLCLIIETTLLVRLLNKLD